MRQQVQFALGEVNLIVHSIHRMEFQKRNDQMPVKVLTQLVRQFPHCWALCLLVGFVVFHVDKKISHTDDKELTHYVFAEKFDTFFVSNRKQQTDVPGSDERIEI